jgi:hypothetical protein
VGTHVRPAGRRCAFEPCEPGAVVGRQHERARAGLVSLGERGVGRNAQDALVPRGDGRLVGHE